MCFVKKKKGLTVISELYGNIISLRSPAYTGKLMVLNKEVDVTVIVNYY